MKILLVQNMTYLPSYGGGAKANRLLLESLSRLGHECRALVPASGVQGTRLRADMQQELRAREITYTSTADEDHYQYNGVEIHACEDAAKLRQHISYEADSFDSDVILVSCEDLGQMLLEAAVETNKPVIYLVHTVYHYLPFGPFAFMKDERKTELIKRCCGVIAVSEYVKHYLYEYGKITSEVLYMPAYGSESISKTVDTKRGFVTLVNPSQLKGLSIFLELADIFPDHQFASVATWATTSGDLELLENRPNHSSLRASDDIDDVFADTRILLVPSLIPEAFGQIAVEAMLRGIPVLASDVGGLKEAKLGVKYCLPVNAVTKYDGTQFDERMNPLMTIPLQDIYPWQEALTRLFTDQAYYASLSSQSYKAAQGFLTKTNANNFENFIDSSLSKVRANLAEQRPHKRGYLSVEEKQKILYEWNDTSKQFDDLACVQDLIRKQTEKTPQAIAVMFGDETLTYEQLADLIEKQASRIRNAGVKAKAMVAILCERSIDLIVGILGIIKAGAAYIPLDPSYPEERLEFMLKDCNADALVLQTDRQSPLTGLLTINVDISGFTEEATASAKADQPDTTLDDPAYVIYTSGSTGQPKGAIISHRSLVNGLLWMRETYGLTETDRVLQKAPTSFDVSVWEIFTPLISGAALVIAQPDGHKDPEYLAAVINEFEVTDVHFVPSMLRPFLEVPSISSIKSLKRVLCSGESLPKDLVFSFFDKFDCDLINLYGTTEVAVEVTSWQCQKDFEGSVVPIGKPIANTQIYILDSDQEPVPVGATGEIYVGGVQIAQGYLNRPELTREKFITDPFCEGSNGFLYKTGDLAHYLPNGEIEFLGRLDDQVKINGQRIELSEIEAALLNLSIIKEAAVRPTKIGDSEELVGYLICYEQPRSSDIRSSLAKTLPKFMVPTKYVILDSFPLNLSGKLDNKMLFSYQNYLVDSDSAFSEPQNDIERVLLTIWKSVLNIQTISTSGSFFDLGGHSLTGLKVISRVQEVLGVTLPLRAIFEAPTIRQLAQQLGSTGKINVEVSNSSAGSSSVFEGLKVEEIDVDDLSEDEVEMLLKSETRR